MRVPCSDVESLRTWDYGRERCLRSTSSLRLGVDIGPSKTRRLIDYLLLPRVGLYDVGQDSLRRRFESKKRVEIELWKGKRLLTYNLPPLTIARRPLLTLWVKCLLCDQRAETYIDTSASTAAGDSRPTPTSFTELRAINGRERPTLPQIIEYSQLPFLRAWSGLRASL